MGLSPGCISPLADSRMLIHEHAISIIMNMVIRAASGTMGIQGVPAQLDHLHTGEWGAIERGHPWHQGEVVCLCRLI